ncbi:MAG: carbohydrate binding domain-containing protein [Bacteroidetes bacterium]|nr:carbohydrate binding domain-containing protein [Bacteroidota bacterium]MCH8523393.1 carbohydrate binding domain-containing protein [Balneolales bacterium]
MKKNIQHAVLALALSLGFMSYVAPAVNAQDADNLIINGDFATGNLDGWTTFTNGITVEFGVQNGEAAVTNIANPGGAVWYIQLNQVLSPAQIDALEVGQAYKVTFDARSPEAGRQLRMFFGEERGGFASQNITDIALTTSMQGYEATFTLTAKYPEMKLGFELGLSAADVFIDNVVMVATDDAPVAGGGLNLPITFEDPDLDYGLEDFGGNTSEIVEDPTDSGNRVVRSLKTENSEPWAGTSVGAGSGFATPIPFSPGNTTMSVRVWSPKADIPVRLKVENVNDNTMSVETEVRTTVAEAWETLVFDFAVQAAGTEPINFGSTYNMASMFFNFGTPGDGSVYFWDDLEFGGEGSATGPAAPVGFDVNNAPAAVPMEPGDIFLSVGPNNVGQGGIVYRLFYALAADNVADPITGATQYTFGSTAGDGNGTGAFGFVLGGLQPGAEYTFWLFQYNTTTEEYSAPAVVTRSTVGEGNGDDNGNGNGGDNGDTNTLNLPVTFEDVDRDYGFDDFGDGTTTDIVVDPTDSNNRVARTVKDGGEPWSGTTLGHPAGFATAIPFDQNNTTMSVRVWSPNADIPVRLKVENSNDPTVSVEAEVRTTVAAQWETLVFDFTNQAPGTAPINFASRYNKASIFFDFNTVGTGETYYWDDMIFGGEAVVTAPGTPLGFEASSSIGGDPVGSGEIFLVAGPNNTDQANISYRLFYAKTADALEDPLQGTQHVFGTIAGDGEGNGPFGFVLGGLEAGTEYNFWLFQYNSATDLYSEPALAVAVTGGESTNLEDGANVPAEYSLSQNFPNPFNPTTRIQFELPESGQVKLEVFNMMGQRVATLVNETRSAGSHSVTFDASALSSGMYLYRLQAGNTVLMNKMTLLK